MKSRRILQGCLAAFGLAIFLWPALSAPVVLWSDSQLDLGWARRGEGIVTPVISPHHPPKPGYILFLREALEAGPAESAGRRIVVIQSLLLWLAIAAAALAVGRRAGPRWGVALYLALVLFLRLRDVSSAVMSEALTAAFLLSVAAALLDPPARMWTCALLGLATAALFLVRPNAGAAALILAAASLALSGRPWRIAPLLLGFVLLWAPVWRATNSAAGDPFRGMAPAFITGSVDYGWTPEREPRGPEPPAWTQVRTALANWKATFSEEPGDLGRQLAWRAWHGLLGTDYYDARWSPVYARMTTASRTAAPLLILAAIAALIAAPLKGATRVAKGLGLLLVAIVVGQSLVLGALPRLAIPFVPALLLFGVVALAGLDGAARTIAAAAAFAALLGLAAWQRQVLDEEWGLVEARGVRLVQKIPRGALPERSPATLHVRIAPLIYPSDARVVLLGPDGKELPTAPSASAGQEGPYLTVALPERLLAANRDGPIFLTLVARNGYDATHFQLFPIVPPFWGAPARREKSSELSPETGIPSGSLDWWAHQGTR